MAQDTDNKSENGKSERPPSQLPERGPELETDGLVNRVRSVLALARSLTEASVATRMPISTLVRLRDGQEPKLSQAVRLSEGFGIRLEWLATGEGPMRVGEEPAALRYIDFENLAAGLEIAEELQPEAPAEARISAALRAAARIRKRQQDGTATPVDAQLLGGCLQMIETLFGRDRPVIRRLRPAVGAYELMMADPPGPDEAKPASEAELSG